MTKITLSTGTLFHLPLEEIFDVIKAAQFDGLELLLDNEIHQKGVPVLRALSVSHKLPILSVHAPLDHIQIFGDTADAILERTRRLATDIGTSKVVVHPYRIGSPHYENELSHWMTENLPTAGPKIFIENLPKQVQSEHLIAAVYDPQQLAAQFTAICLDTSHLATTGLDLKKIVSINWSKIGHVHLSDSNFKPINDQANRDEHLPPGAGKLPLEWLVKFLQQHGYAGDYCIELRPANLAHLSHQELTKFLQEMVFRVKRWID